MATVQDRIQSLQRTAKEYIDAERKRTENHVKVLEDVLNGRTAGKGVQKVSVKVVQAAADKDLATYLKGA